MMTDEELQANGLHKGFIGPVNLPEGIRLVCDESCASPSSGPAVPTRSIITLPVPAPSATLPSMSGQIWSPSLPAIPARTAASRSLLPAASRSRRSSSWAPSTPRPWVPPLWTRTARRSRSSWVATALVCPARLLPSWSSTTTNTASSGRSPLPRTSRGDSARSQEGGVRNRLRPNRRGLCAEGIEVVVDDRDERPGFKFADNDLMGFPYQVVLGKRGLKNGTVELKDVPRASARTWRLTRSSPRLPSLLRRPAVNRRFCY